MVAEGAVVMAIVGHHTTQPVLRGGGIAHHSMEHLVGDTCRRVRKEGGREGAKGEGGKEEGRERERVFINAHWGCKYMCIRTV